MKVEHVALDVADPVAFCDWWVKNLGFRVTLSNPGPGFCHFIVDETGKFAFEVYRAADSESAPDYSKQSPLTLHLAFLSDDVDADAARLIAAGATQVEVVHKPGFDMAMLRDPFGVPIQLVKRGTPVLL
jgi:catechol 2,3-dioxygenase-like lactoylglutathione lyase family enzyme